MRKETVDPLPWDRRKERWAIPPEEGPNKVCDLREAIAKQVNPGMWLHVAHFHYRPSAAMNELARQFWGKAPRFILSTTGLRDNLVIFLHGGLVRQVISTFCGDVYPSPAPNPIVQAAYLQRKVEFENWSLLSMVQGFMAGAMGLDFMATRSLLGSTMEEENKLVGSGGANDAASLAGEIVAVARQSRESFVEKVPYITSPGERVKTLISDLGVFKKREEEKEFTLTAYFPSGSLGEKEIVSRIGSRCGWRLRVDANLGVLPPPAQEKIILLRSFDPRGDFIGERKGD